MAILLTFNNNFYGPRVNYCRLTSMLEPSSLAYFDKMAATFCEGQIFQGNNFGYIQKENTDGK